MNFVATSVFFAQMAYIENLGVRNVLLSDGSTIEGGMCHSDKNDYGGSLGLGDVRFWLGSESPSLGKIRGYKDGKFVAADGKAVFDSSGDVTLCGGNAKFDKNGNTTIANLPATSGEFNGSLKADLFYSRVKVNAESGYQINPEVAGYNTFYWEYDGVKPERLNGVYAHRIFLPDAVRYDGIELCFMWTQPRINSLKYLYVYSFEEQQDINIPINYTEAEINGSLMLIQTAHVKHYSSKFFACLPNQYFRVKAMNGQWFIISGNTTG